LGRAAVPDEPEAPGNLRHVPAVPKTDRGHNFIRLWRWEQIGSQGTGRGPTTLNMTPQPCAATDLGRGQDDEPRRPRPVGIPPLRPAAGVGWSRPSRPVVYVGVHASSTELGAAPQPGPGQHRRCHPIQLPSTTSTASRRRRKLDDQKVLSQARTGASSSCRRTYVRHVVDVAAHLPNVLLGGGQRKSSGGRRFGRRRVSPSFRSADRMPTGATPRPGSTRVTSTWSRGARGRPNATTRTRSG
jgi:hypothetical protein